MARRRRPITREQLNDATPEEVALIAEYLADADDVAEEIGVSSGNVVRTYQHRHPDTFPPAMYPEVLVRGKNQIWWRPFVRRWRRQHPGQSSPDVTPDA